MDSGRLPPYRSSYLLRFHPYPRMKVPARERIETIVREPLVIYESPQVDLLYLESDTSFTLNQVIHGTGVHDEMPPRRRRLSLSSVAVDLALLFSKKLSLYDNVPSTKLC